VKDINNIPRLIADMPAIIDRIAKKIGEYLEAKIVDMINRQHPGWQPNAPATIQRKGSSKVWVDSSELRTLITHQIEGTLPKVVKIGIFDHDKGAIAHFLEFGTTRGIPERPLFRLVFDLEQEKVIGIIEKELDMELRRYEI